MVEQDPGEVRAQGGEGRGAPAASIGEADQAHVGLGEVHGIGGWERAESSGHLV